MEFLLTYGWAIVIVVTAIAALAYFGVLDADRWMPNYCHIEGGLSCLDHSVSVYDGFTPTDKYNKLELRLRNNIGWNGKIKYIQFPAYGTSENYVLGPPPNDGILILSGEETDAGDSISEIDDITDADNTDIVFNHGEQYSIEFIIEIENTESALPHKYVGIIKGKVR